MATCPDCGASSRTDPTFVVEPALVAEPPGTYSLAGAQDKVSAVSTLRLRHGGCGWYVTGRVDGDHFVADTRTGQETTP